MIDIVRGWLSRRSEGGEELVVRGVRCGVGELWLALMFYAPLVALAWMLGGWTWGVGGGLAALAWLLGTHRFEVRVDAAGLHLTDRYLMCGYIPCVERTHMSHGSDLKLYRDRLSERAVGLIASPPRHAWSEDSGLTFMAMHSHQAERIGALVRAELERRRSPHAPPNEGRGHAGLAP